MNNLSSYCGLVDAKRRASDKDLPVPQVLRRKYSKGSLEKKNAMIIFLCQFENMIEKSEQETTSKKKLIPKVNSLNWTFQFYSFLFNI